LHPAQDEVPRLPSALGVIRGGLGGGAFDDPATIDVDTIVNCE
jgi:hypothetical protein